MTEEENTKKRLGDFEIIRELGRGGMGIVYEARQVSLNRKVALKVISASLGLSSKAVLRFQREAEAAGKLHHTNIVPIYSTGQDDGTHYYAMELINGPSLQQVIGNMRERQKDDQPAASSRKGAGNSSTEHVGLSSILGELPSWVSNTFAGHADSGSRSSTSSSSLTMTDSSSSLQSGTHYYDTVARMIAEVADALDHAHENGVIHRDIKPANLLLSPEGHLSVNDFGLARMLEQPGMTMSGEFVGSPLYMSPEQITAGRVPLDHRTDIFSLGSTLYELLTLTPPFPGRGRDEVMARIMQKDPRRPRTVNKKVPVDLETICLKALEKDPDQRYPTAGQLAEDLRRFISRFEITARRAGPVARVVKWVRRRPAMAGLLACLVVAALATGILAHALSRAGDEARLAKGEAAVEQALVELFGGRFDEVEPRLERAEVYDVDPGRLRILRGAAAAAEGQIEKAIRELELAIEQLPESLAAHALLAGAYLSRGRGDDYNRIMAKVQKLTPVTQEDYLYGARYTYGERSEQTKWLRKVASERSSPVAEMLLGERLVDNLAKTYDPGRIEEALVRVTTARSMMSDNVRAASLYVHAHLVAADIHRLEGNLADYKRCLKNARSAAEELLKNFEEHSAAIWANALLAAYENDWQEAATQFADLDNVRDSYENYALKTLLYLHGQITAEGVGELFMTLLRTGQVEELKRRIEALLSTESPPRVSRGSRSWVFEAFSVLGRPQDATRYSKSYLERIGTPMGKMGEFYEAVDRYVCGETSAEDLLAAAESSSTRRRHRLHVHLLLGLEHLSRGDRQEAVKYFESIERAGSYLFFSQPKAAVLLKRLRDDPTWPPWIPVKDPAGALRK